jgi:hypothetical protein
LIDSIDNLFCVFCNVNCTVHHCYTQDKWVFTSRAEGSFGVNKNIRLERIVS